MIEQARQDHPEVSVRWLCQMFGVNRSWYLHQCLSKPASSLEADTRLRDAIERLCLDFPGYGYRRVTAQLRRDGWTINHKKVLAVMRRESLLCHLKRAFQPASPGSAKAAYPNLIKDLAVTALDQVWVVDITYIRLPQGFVYLACVLDAFSRRCIGWHLSQDINTHLTLSALEHLGPDPAPAHAGLDPPFGSGRPVRQPRLCGPSARDRRILISMSAAGCPYENAKAESFFKTLKKEEVSINQYPNFEEAYANLGNFLEDVYNVKRLHSSLGYLPPVEFEATHNAKHRANHALICKS